jgi:hypothetical protein
MDEKARRRVRVRLKRRGFDLTKSFRDGTVKPGCSQCQALCIQGTACHEIGCPNNKRKGGARWR